MSADEKTYRVSTETRIGHIHLRVADLERSLHFYRDRLGFEISGTYDGEAAFLAAGGYHHHIAINTWGSKGGTPPPKGHTGLYHFAILYPSRQELARAVKRLLDARHPIDGTADHGVSEAVYLRDPDNNGIELYCDRPREQWPRNHEGTVAMFTKPLELADLLRELA